MTGRDRMIIVLLVTVAVLGGVWMLVVSPKRDQSAALDKQVASAQRDADTAVQQTAAAATARRRYAADSAAVAALGKALPTQQETASLLYQLDAAAGRSRVQLKSITPAGTGPGTTPAAISTTLLPPGVTEVPLALSFEGRYADLERFLHRLLANADVSGTHVAVRGRLINVHGLQLTATTGDGRVSATVDASAYVTASTTPAAPSTGASPTAPAAGASSTPPTTPAAIGATG